MKETVMLPTTTFTTQTKLVDSGAFSPRIAVLNPYIKIKKNIWSCLYFITRDYILGVKSQFGVHGTLSLRRYPYAGSSTPCN